MNKQDLEKKLDQWISSGEAEIALKKASEEALRVIDKLNELRKLMPWIY